MSPKKILVTGASGYIGFNLAKFLSKLFKVEGLVKDKKKFDFLKDQYDEIKYHNIDLLNYNFSLNSYEVIIHCALPNDVVSRDEDAGLKLSILGTQNLMQACTKIKVKKLIFLSTAQVFGTNLIGHIDEDQEFSLENNYALNHKLAEDLLKYHCKKNKIELYILRIFNVFGGYNYPFYNRNTLVPFCFFESLLKSNEIILRGNGNQIRNFVHIDEVSVNIKKIIDYKNDQLINHINIFSNYYSSILEIAKLSKNIFENTTGKESSLKINLNDKTTKNSFTIISKNFNPINDKNETKQLMKKEIEKYFINFND